MNNHSLFHLGLPSYLLDISLVGRAIYRAGADARLVPATAPQCCRISSAAPLPSGGIPSGTAPLVSLPLAVPFPAQCAFSECLIFAVQSPFA